MKSVEILLLQFLSMAIVMAVAGKKPNILLMIADDLGIGDIGCFGNTTLRTPYIDSIAKQGVQLNQHLTASSLCTPSRAAFLTGRYPARSGMAPHHVVRVSIFTASSLGLPSSEITFAKLAQQAGYETALIGKWHQGWSRDKFNDFQHHPRNYGFDYFYGLPLTNLKDYGDDKEYVLFSFSPYLTERLLAIFLVVSVSAACLYRTSHIGIFVLVFIVSTSALFTGSIYMVFTNLKILNSVIYRNFDLVEQPIDLETQMRKEVIEGQEFLQARRADDKPFLLVMSWIHVHTYLAPAKQFLGKSKHGKYGDSVEELDWAVGEMLRSLTDLGLEENTLVYFTSDNGGHLEERNIHGEVEGGYNSIYKGGKGHGAVDGGIRVPSMMKWPGQIPAGSVSNEPTSLMDILPTLATIMDVPVPSDRQMDGRNILPVLKGESSISPHDFLFHYCGEDIHAVRYRPRDGTTTWKLVLKDPTYQPGEDRCEFVCQCNQAITLNPPHLFDMTSDPGERKPISISRHPDIYKKMTKALQEHRESVKPVTPQFTFQKLVWRPWLQMCCNNNYPTCFCEDEKFKGKFTKKP